MWVSGQIEDGAKAHANLFLSFVQMGNYDAAYGTSEYMGDTSLYSAAQFQSCLLSTPIGDMTSYSCDDAEVDLADQDADVICVVQSASQGAQEITVHVNSPTDFPYLGFIWFSPGTVFGPAWPSNECARWSGREFFEGPPEGRISPGPAGYTY
jgi:hypothetical protein